MQEEFRINHLDTLDDFLSGTVLLLDKPLGWTSFDVVNKIKWYVRHHCKAPKFKIGHAGTLDPLANGLLVICVGKYTKRIDSFQGGTKEYTGTICLGQVTPSYDLETAPEGDFAFDHLTEEALRSNARSFEGEQLQMPPVYSAKWINGQRAYDAARKGEEIEMRRALIHVESFELTRIALPEVDFRIRCSKGTYIRSLAHDFGGRLGSGSYLKSLRRTVSEPFTVADSMQLDDVLAAIDARFKPKAL